MRDTLPSRERNRHELHGTVGKIYFIGFGLHRVFFLPADNGSLICGGLNGWVGSGGDIIDCA